MKDNKKRERHREKNGGLKSNVIEKKRNKGRKYIKERKKEIDSWVGDSAVKARKLWKAGKSICTDAEERRTRKASVVRLVHIDATACDAVITCTHFTLISQIEFVAYSAY